MVRKKKSSICELSSEEKKRLIQEIQTFYYDSRGEEIGVIGSEEVLEFFIENLGNTIYNKALDDAAKWYNGMQESIQADYYSLYKE
ncbi:MAG: DUF2164 domain-containing protein [Clostridiales bacterium]|nr:DUF2164 domain-containing protein [Clostridiales bacterium]